MKVLLTGSSGFIGGAVAEALTARGDEVVRVDLMTRLALLREFRVAQAEVHIRSLAAR